MPGSAPPSCPSRRVVRSRRRSGAPRAPAPSGAQQARGRRAAPPAGARARRRSPATSASGLRSVEVQRPRRSPRPSRPPTAVARPRRCRPSADRPPAASPDPPGGSAATASGSSISAPGPSAWIASLSSTTGPVSTRIPTSAPAPRPASGKKYMSSAVVTPPSTDSTAAARVPVGDGPGVEHRRLGRHDAPQEVGQVQVVGEAPEHGHRQVRVGIDEAGHQQVVGQVDPIRRRHACQHVDGRPDVDDGPVADRHRCVLDHRVVGVDGQQHRRGEHQVDRCGGVVGSGSRSGGHDRTVPGRVRDAGTMTDVSTGDRDDPDDSVDER